MAWQSVEQESAWAELVLAWVLPRMLKLETRYIRLQGPGFRAEISTSSILDRTYLASFLEHCLSIFFYRGFVEDEAVTNSITADASFCGSWL